MMSSKDFIEAKKYIPGGVNSPVRAFKAVDGTPLFIKKGMGSKIYDIRGKKFIDYCMSFGPLILGHAHPRIIKSVKKAVQNGTSFGAPTLQETRLAKQIVGAIPSIQKVRLVNSGTEAVMSALRLARGFAKKDKVIKFDGCYHGHVDSLLVKSGSGLATFGIASSAGISHSLRKDTLVAEYNNLNSLKKIIKKQNDIAALIIEPIPANIGVVLPEANFLQGLREITQDNNIILIFDEVITGFRVSYGGAQKYYRLKPDLTILGKIIGGGFPIGAFGGKKEIMELLAPDGPVYQAGTLSGNPVATTAGIETLKLLKNKSIYRKLENNTDRFVNSINNNKIKINNIASMFTLFFNKNKKIDNCKKALQSDTKQFAMLHKRLLQSGVYFPPSQFEACFISKAHSLNELKKTSRVINMF